MNETDVTPTERSKVDQPVATAIGSLNTAARRNTIPVTTA